MFITISCSNWQLMMNSLALNKWKITMRISIERYHGQHMSTPCWNLAVYLIPRWYYFRCNYEIIFTPALVVLSWRVPTKLFFIRRLIVKKDWSGYQFRWQRAGHARQIQNGDKNIENFSRISSNPNKLASISGKKYPLVRRTTNFGKLLVRRHFLLVTDDRTSANSTSAKLYKIRQYNDQVPVISVS